MKTILKMIKIKTPLCRNRGNSTNGSFLIELLVGTGMSLALFLVVAGALTWSRQQHKSVAGATEVSSTLLLVYQSIMNMRGDTPAIWNTVPKPADNEGKRSDEDVEGNLIKGLFLHNRDEAVRPYGDETQVRTGVTDDNSRILDGVPAFLKDVYFITQQKQQIRLTANEQALASDPTGSKAGDSAAAQCTLSYKYNVTLVIEVGVFRQGYSPGQYAQATSENQALHRPLSVEKIQIPLVVYEHPDFQNDPQQLVSQHIQPPTPPNTNTICPDEFSTSIWDHSDSSDDSSCNDAPSSSPATVQSPARTVYVLATGREQKACPYSQTSSISTDGRHLGDDPLIFVQSRGSIAQANPAGGADIPQHIYSYTYVCRMSFRETIERYGSKRRFGGAFSCAFDDKGDERRYCQRPTGNRPLARSRLYHLLYLRSLGECKHEYADCKTPEWQQSAAGIGHCNTYSDSKKCLPYEYCVRRYCTRGIGQDNLYPHGTDFSNACFDIKTLNNNDEKCGLCQYWEGDKDLAEDRGGPKGKKSCVEFCFNPNPATGNCSCPDGFRAHPVRAVHKNLDDSSSLSGDLNDNHYGFYQCVDIRGPMGGRDCPEDCQPRSNSCLQGTSWCKQRCN